MSKPPKKPRRPRGGQVPNEVVASSDLIIYSFTADCSEPKWVPATSRVGFEQRPLRRPDDDAPPPKKK